ncbi:unnamed protein product [Schistocephalus solidus]|uniref:Hexosyltransferase n=1 Tax=Schistocephalus solidus TaxID=70667 RepID=A0A183S918_SCHSO|nr:unnamed protein product [Schistocephalus solidus]
MIIVKSALTNYARRHHLREVIRRQAVQINATVGLLFNLGLPANGQLSLDLLNEITTFDDILLANYTDTYLNLTLKTIVNLRFVHRHCLHTSHSFVFLDDDHGINLTQLHQVFSTYSTAEVRRSSFGFVTSNAPVIRLAGHKCFVATSDFPFPRYPDYQMGLIPKLSIASAFTRLLPNEDTYVGMMLFKLGVKTHHLSNLIAHKTNFPPNTYPLVAGLDFFTKSLSIR